MRRRVLVVLLLAAVGGCGDDERTAPARDPDRGTNRNQLWQRFVYALLDLCKKRDDPSYRPAAEAVRRVRNGEYLLRGGPPQHREDRRRAREP